MKNTHIHIKALLIAVVFCLNIIPCVCFADNNSGSVEVMYYTVSGASLPSNYTGNTSSLIDVRNPSTSSSSTTTKSFAISAIAKQGVVVTVYAYNASSGRYEKAVGENNEIMQTTVGASNLYAATLSLKNGSNKFMIVATKDGLTETAKFEINLLSPDFKDRLKSFSVGIMDMFS